MFLLAVMAQPIEPAPASAVIFGRERWYQTVKGDEETFVGVLQRIPGTGRNSRNAFCLVMGEDGQNNTRDVFIGTDNRNLLPYVNRRVKIVGMAVDLKVDGRMRYEIWPARLEAGGGGGVVGIGGDVNIIASSGWSVPIGMGPVPFVGTGQIQAVARSKDELQQLLPKGQTVDALTKALNVDTIQFKKNMVILVSGGVCQGPGYSVDATVDMVDRTLLVRWRLNKPAVQPGNANLTHPGRVLLVPRYDGQVLFNPPAKRLP
jgi:hypothetical protein